MQKFKVFLLAILGLAIILSGFNHVALAVAPTAVLTLKVGPSTINKDEIMTDARNSIIVDYKATNIQKLYLKIFEDSATTALATITVFDPSGTTSINTRDISGKIFLDPDNQIFANADKTYLLKLTGKDLNNKDISSTEQKITVYSKAPTIDENSFTVKIGKTDLASTRNAGDFKRSNDTAFGDKITITYKASTTNSITKIALVFSNKSEIALDATQLSGTKTYDADDKNTKGDYLFPSGKNSMVLKIWGSTSSISVASKKAFTINTLDKPTLNITEIPDDGTIYTQDSKKTSPISSTYTTAKDRINIVYSAKNVSNACVVVDDDEVNCFKNFNISSPSGEKKIVSIDTDYIATGIHNIYLKYCNGSSCYDAVGDTKSYTIKGSGPIIDSFRYNISNDSSLTDNYITDGKYKGQKITLSYGVRGVKSLAIKTLNSVGTEIASTTALITSPYNKTIEFTYLDPKITGNATSTPFSFKLVAKDDSGKGTEATLNITNNSDKTLILYRKP